jgi:hypothetical protein
MIVLYDVRIRAFSEEQPDARNEEYPYRDNLVELRHGFFTGLQARC